MKLNIAVLAGDGIGPEVIDQALKVTKAICDKYGHELNYEHGITGACAIDEVGDPYPEATHELCMNADAVLYGAIGDPKYDNNPKATVRPEQGLLGMRQKLGLYANLRPVVSFPSLIHKSPLRTDLVDGADFMCIRELTGGIYFGDRGRKDDGNTAFDTCIYTREEVERIIKLGYEYAMKRNKKLTIVDKANVLESSRLWRESAKKWHLSIQKWKLNSCSLITQPCASSSGLRALTSWLQKICLVTSSPTKLLSSLAPWACSHQHPSAYTPAYLSLSTALTHRLQEKISLTH